jgi:hypothetical protein
MAGERIIVPERDGMAAGGVLLDWRGRRSMNKPGGPRCCWPPLPPVEAVVCAGCTKAPSYIVAQCYPGATYCYLQQQLSGLLYLYEIWFVGVGRPLVLPFTGSPYNCGWYKQISPPATGWMVAHVIIRYVSSGEVYYEEWSDKARATALVHVVSGSEPAAQVEIQFNAYGDSAGGRARFIPEEGYNVDVAGFCDGGATGTLINWEPDCTATPLTIGGGIVDVTFPPVPEEA